MCLRGCMSSAGGNAYVLKGMHIKWRSVLKGMCLRGCICIPLSTLRECISNDALEYLSSDAVEYLYVQTYNKARHICFVCVCWGGSSLWKSPSVHGTTQCRVHISAERPVFPPKRALYSCQRALYLHLQFHRLWGIVHCPIPPVCTNIKNQCKFIWNIALNCGHIGLLRRNMRIFGVFETTHIVPYHLCVNISLDMKREIYKYRRHIVPVYTHEYTRMHISTSTRTRTSTRQAHDKHTYTYTYTTPQRTRTWTRIGTGTGKGTCTGTGTNTKAHKAQAMAQAQGHTNTHTHTYAPHRTNSAHTQTDTLQRLHQIVGK